MLRFLIRRVLIALPTIILISIFVFALQKLLPGDPLLVLAGEERDPEVLEFLREKYRLNDPIPVQYLAWVGNALQGDLGTSLRTNQPVTELMAQKLPVTIQLAVMSMIFALVIGIPAGILSAVKKGTVTDYVANVVALSGLSVPNFWLRIMLILLVSVKWQLLLSWSSSDSNIAAYWSVVSHKYLHLWNEYHQWNELSRKTNPEFSGHMTETYVHALFCWRQKSFLR